VVGAAFACIPPHFSGAAAMIQAIAAGKPLPRAKKMPSQNYKVSFLIKLADLYLKPETLKAKNQTPKQPNSQQPRLK
jgi:hypothetical protein